MAKLSKGIFGPISGKLGSIVGATWKNVAYLRERPKKKKKKGPRTAGQIAGQMKFKFMSTWLVPFYPYVTIGFRLFAQNKTEINAAFSINYHKAIIGSYPNLEVDYEKVCLSKGDLAGLNEAEIVLSNEGTVLLCWQRNDVNDDASYDDQVMLVLYSRELGIADGFIGGTRRADMICDFKINAKLRARVLDVWVSLYSVNGKKVSCSTYLGKIGL